jgi:galactarate dehydratase
MLSQNEHRTDAPLYIRLRDDDNVAIVANRGGLQRGAEFAGGLKLTEQIPQGHKVALADIAAGAAITRYGEVIGHAAAAIARGSWVKEALVLMPEAPSLTNLPKSRGSGRKKTWSDKWGIFNSLALFNPGPVT